MQMSLVAMAIALAACSGGKSSVVSLDDMPVVTHQEMKDGQDVTVCDLELVTDTIDLPLPDTSWRIRRDTHPHRPHLSTNSDKHKPKE